MWQLLPPMARASPPFWCWGTHTWSFSCTAWFKVAAINAQLTGKLMMQTLLLLWCPEVNKVERRKSQTFEEKMSAATCKRTIADRVYYQRWRINPPHLQASRVDVSVAAAGSHKQHRARQTTALSDTLYLSAATFTICVTPRIHLEPPHSTPSPRN